MERRVTSAWNAEYASGRYVDEPPVAFVDDIIAASRSRPDARGLYIGCGNGRNFAPLLHAGVDLIGIDISETALRQLRERISPTIPRLVCGDVGVLDPSASFDPIVAIQVFQHGSRGTAHRNIREAQRRVAPNGIICLRVNSVATDLFPSHDVVEWSDDCSFTVRYRQDAKAGLDIHFFAETELLALFADGFEPLLNLREHATKRTPPAPGQWTQWEGIWRRKPHVLPGIAYTPSERM